MDDSFHHHLQEDIPLVSNVMLVSRNCSFEKMYEFYSLDTKSSLHMKESQVNRNAFAYHSERVCL